MGVDATAENAGFIGDENSPRGKKVGKIKKMMVGNPAGRSTDKQYAGMIPR